MLKSSLLFSTALAFVLAVNPMKAAAAVSPDTIAADLQAQGFTYIEITQGPTQSKVEATKGDTKVETIIDNATGQVLKTETNAADPENIGQTGVTTQTQGDDFLSVGDDSEVSDDKASDDTKDVSDSNEGQTDDGNSGTGSDDSGSNGQSGDNDGGDGQSGDSDGGNGQSGDGDGGDN